LQELYQELVRGLEDLWAGLVIVLEAAMESGTEFPEELEKVVLVYPVVGEVVVGVMGQEA
jgi:hypothetical protein